MAILTGKFQSFLNKSSQPGQVNNKTKFQLSLPIMPVALSNSLIHMAYIKFYTDLVGLDVQYVGILYMVFGIWNAINDPMMGVFIDRFKFTKKCGKYAYLMWDLYNEPGNSRIESFALVQSVFQWAREIDPLQPLTVGVWNNSPQFKNINEFQLANSDIVTFHHYGKLKPLQKLIDKLKAQYRPLICTEWMARTEGSHVQTNLPVFQRNNVGCINWGLVAGKTNTIYPWQTTWTGIKNQILSLVGRSKTAGAEPNPWFHDLFCPDGSPYNEDEISFFSRTNFELGVSDEIQRELLCRRH